MTTVFPPLHPSLRSGQALPPSQSLRNYRLRLLLDPLQVVPPDIALGVELVDLLGSGWAGREPSLLRDHLEAADRGPVARRTGQATDDPVARYSRVGDLIWR